MIGIHLRRSAAPAVLIMMTISIGCTEQQSRSSTSIPRLSSPAPQSPSLVLPGLQRTATAVDALNAMTDELNAARQTVGETVMALEELSNAQGDLVAPFERFIGLNERLDEADRRLESRGDEVRSRAREYITNWEVEVFGVEDPDLRQQADARRTRVRQDYERISDAMRALRVSMGSFSRQTKDLQTFFSQDLTLAGVRAAMLSSGRAQQSGRQVQKQIDKVISEVDRVANNMSHATTAPSVQTAPAESVPSEGNK